MEIVDRARRVEADLRLRAIIPGNPAERGADIIDELINQLQKSMEATASVLRDLDAERGRIASSAYHQRIVAKHQDRADRVLSWDDMGNYETGWVSARRDGMSHFLADAGWHGWVRDEYLKPWTGESSEAIRTGGADEGKH